MIIIELNPEFRRSVAQLIAEQVDQTLHLFILNVESPGLLGTVPGYHLQA